MLLRIDERDGQAIALEAGVEVLEIRETAGEERRADDEQQRQRDLADDEQTPQERA